MSLTRRSGECSDNGKMDLETDSEQRLRGFTTGTERWVIGRVGGGLSSSNDN